MTRRLSVGFLVAATAILAAAPLAAQSAHNRPTVSFPPSQPQIGVVGQVFVPGFGFRPIIQERTTSQGFRGFHGHRGFGFSTGFIGGGFRFGNGFGFGYVPFYSTLNSAPTVVIVQQSVPVSDSDSARRLEDSRGGGAVVVAGLPENWDERPPAESGEHRERSLPGQLTLLAFKDDTILPVTEYWLEDGLIFYVTATGRQGSVALRNLDWDMTTQLNAERNVEFVLHSPR